MYLGHAYRGQWRVLDTLKLAVVIHLMWVLGTPT